MYKLIIVYLVGIVVTVNFNPDLYFVLMSFILSFIFLIVYKGSKAYMSFINLCIYFLIFTLSIIYTKHQFSYVSYRDFGEKVFELKGEVVDMKQSGLARQVTIKVKSMSDLSLNTMYSSYPNYINVIVSPYSNYELYDNLDVIGNVDFTNYQVTYTEQPLFFSYQFEKLFYNTPYNVSQPKNIKLIDYNKNLVENLISRFYILSETLKSRIGLYMNEPYASVASGISLGDQDYILKDIKDIFKKSGLIHILVLSGANVSFIISLLWYFLNRAKNKYKILLATFFAWIFIFITGLTPPSIRAGVMSTTNIGSEYFGKNISAIQSLLFSLFILTILNPLSLIYSPSLHLSFLSCFGLFVIAEKLEKKFQNSCKFLDKHNFINFIFSTFTGIFLTTTPYILAMNGSSSFFGTLLTFLTEPFVALTTILSFLIILTSFINFYLAFFFGILNTVCVKIILAVADFGANYLPLINYQIPKFILISYYLFLFCIFLISPKYAKYEIKI